MVNLRYIKLLLGLPKLVFCWLTDLALNGQFQIHGNLMSMAECSVSIRSQEFHKVLFVCLFFNVYNCFCFIYHDLAPERLGFFRNYTIFLW